jgi:hypothetical protein
MDRMTIPFSGPIWCWRGPGRFYFVTVPSERSSALKDRVPMAEDLAEGTAVAAQLEVTHDRSQGRLHEETNG